MATCPIPFSSPHDMERLVEGQRMLLVFLGDKSGSVVILLEERGAPKCLFAEMSL